MDRCTAALGRNQICPRGLTSEADMRGGSSSYERTVGSKMSEQFLQRVSQRMQLIRRLVIQHHKGVLLRCAVLLLAAMMCFPAWSYAQVIRGDITSGNPPTAVDSAEVAVIQLANAKEYPAVLANGRGEFAVAVSDTGRHALWVRKIGYRPLLTVLAVNAGDTVHVDVVLDEFVVEVEGITVYGIVAETDGQREFWSRRHIAWNTSVDYRDIERLHQGNVSQIVSVLPLTIRGCRPLVYVDGWKRRSMNDLPLDWVYGIEVYRGYFSIPHRYRDPLDSRAKCGAVLIWTKKPR
jgi:hypothetical protein